MGNFIDECNRFHPTPSNANACIQTEGSELRPSENPGEENGIIMKKIDSIRPNSEIGTISDLIQCVVEFG